MNQYLKVYTRIFLITGCTYGVLMLVLYPFLHSVHLGSFADFRMAVQESLLYGTLFGALAGLVLGSSHILLVRAKTDILNQNTLQLSHWREVEIALPQPTAYTLCRDSLKSIRNCSFQDSESTPEHINAIAGKTLTTFGNNISLQLSPLDEKRTSIRISSKPVLPTTLVDYGNNWKNVDTIYSFLQSKKEVRSL